MATLGIQRSFAAGELHPLLAGRADQVKYQTGLRTCRNWVVRKFGGADNRSGFQFCGEAKDSSARTYLAKFVFNADQTYLFEFGDGYIRLFRNGARIVVSGVAAWSNVTAYAVGDLVVSGGVNFYCIAAHTGHAPPNATYWYALTGAIYEIPTPYAVADLAALQFLQNADVVRITHPSYDARELRRYGHTQWTLVATTFGSTVTAPAGVACSVLGADVGYVVTAIDDDTFEESAASGVATGAAPTATAPQTVTWGAVTGAIQYKIYRSWNGLYALVGTAGAASFYDDGITPDPAVSPPVTRDVLSGSGNRPGTAAYWQQRLMLAAVADNPEIVLGSRTNLFTNFLISVPLRDDDAIRFAIAGQKVNPVRHLIGLTELLVFTGAGVWAITGDGQGTLTPKAQNPRQRSTFGAAATPAPVAVGDTVAYIQARGSQLRGVSPDQPAGLDLSLFSSHLVEKYSIERMDYAEVPNSILWIVRNDGTLLGLTYVREQQVLGWHRHDTDGVFEDVCVAPEGGEDAVYVMVRRTIGGMTRRYVERMATRAIDRDDSSTWNFADSFLRYDGAAVGHVSGLEHLEGKDVVALCDGAVVRATVHDGQIDFRGDTYSHVCAGLPYDCDLETLDLDQEGTTVRGKKKKVAAIKIVVDTTQGLTAGPTVDALDEVPDTQELFTGKAEVGIDATWEGTGRYVIRQSDPLPATVLAVIPDGDIGG